MEENESCAVVVDFDLDIHWGGGVACIAVAGVQGASAVNQKSLRTF